LGYFSTCRFLRSPSVHVLRSQVPIADRMIEPTDEDRIVGMIEESGLFGDANFRFFAVGYVMNCSDEIHAAAASIEDRCNADLAVFDSSRVFRDFFPSNCPVLVDGLFVIQQDKVVGWFRYDFVDQAAGDLILPQTGRFKKRRVDGEKTELIMIFDAKVE